jgi:hypothetical protein
LLAPLIDLPLPTSAEITGNIPQKKQPAIAGYQLLLQ